MKIFSQPLRQLAAVALVIINLILCIVELRAPNIEKTLETADISSKQGKAYIAELEFPLPFFYDISGDSMESASSSQLLVFEDARVLGPAHNLHDDIRKSGRGTYSHWGHSLLFSTPDNSDPRTNGRTYTVAAPAHLQSYILFFLIASDLAAVLVFRRFLLELLVTRTRLVSGIVLVSLGTVLASATLGIVGPLNAYTGHAKDFALVGEILLHALLGILVTSVHWLCGGGVAVLIIPERARSLSRIFLLGFPLGLILLAIMVCIALSVPQGRMIAFLLAAASGLPLLACRFGYQDIRSVLRKIGLITPFALMFGTMMGLLWHGPTQTLAASNIGDLTFYAGDVWTLAREFWPLRNLCMEGESYRYFNLLFPGIGAMLAPLPGFDSFLFIAVSGATFFALSTGIALALYAAASRTKSSGDLLPQHLAVVGATLAAARYPSWVIESIPVIHIVPLTVAIWFLAKETSSRVGSVLAVAILALLGSILTKVVTFAVLGPVALARSVGLFLRVRGVWRFIILFAGASALGYIVWMLWLLGPHFLKFGQFGPESLKYFRGGYNSIRVIPLLLRDIATLILGVTVFRLAQVELAVAIAGGLATSLIWPFLFYANFVCAIFIIGLLTLDHPERLQSNTKLLFSALLLALPAVLLGDLAGIQAGITWFACLGPIAWIAVNQGISFYADKSNRGRLTVAAIWSIGALGLLTVALLAVGRGQLIIDSGLRTSLYELTPSVRDIWLAVREKTPKDALIFTDQTGNDTKLLGGWNTYALFGQRQVYIADWQVSKHLRWDPDKRDEVLQRNEQVLRGDIRPTELPLSRRYGSFYAVVRQDRPVPSKYELIYDNKRYRLYRLAP